MDKIASPRPRRTGPPRSAGGRNSPALARSSRSSPAPLRNEPHPVLKAQYTEMYITSQYGASDKVALENSKQQLNQWCSKRRKPIPVYERQLQQVNAATLCRSTVLLDSALDVKGVGEATSAKEAERLAAYSALLQLDSLNLLDGNPSQPPAEVAPEFKLEDGTILTYDLAHQFISYYCGSFDYARPDVIITPSETVVYTARPWDASLQLGNQVLGRATASTKKVAEQRSYMDACVTLANSDTALWASFIETRPKQSQQEPTDPAVLLQTTWEIQKDLDELLADIESSGMYANRATAPFSGSSDCVASRNARQSTHWGDEWLERKSQSMLRRQLKVSQDLELSAIRELRASLPINAHSTEVIDLLEKEDVLICMAATGSGKSTQMPQIILDDWIHKGKGAQCNVVCTQPRRIAAMSVAERVANERGQVLGDEIGYHVRFEQKFPRSHGGITYCTVGILLRKLRDGLLDLSEPWSNGDPTHIIVDEVHERDIDTDLLLCILKRLVSHRQTGRPPLKVILMSATIDPSLFKSYLASATGITPSVLEIPGRQFPVATYFLEDVLGVTKDTRRLPQPLLQDQSTAEYVAQELGPVVAFSYGFTGNKTRPTSTEPTKTPGSALSPPPIVDIPSSLVALSVLHVLSTSTSGHILVFLPGWQELVEVQKALTGAASPVQGMLPSLDSISVHILHSGVPLHEQQAVFEPPARGVRRVILATNIAETSITIPDVVHVIDTARVKQKWYDPSRHMSSLISTWISKSNLNQRVGRAGRHRAGVYYGLFSKARAETFKPHSLVEIQRADLKNVVMHVKALRFRDMSVLDVLNSFIEPPASSNVLLAIENLKIAGALNGDEDLTPLGRILLQLPTDIAVGRMLLYGCLLRCLDPAVTLAAILMERDPFSAPVALRAEANVAKKRFSPTDYRSDVLAVYNAFKEWEQLSEQDRSEEEDNFRTDNYLAKAPLEAISRLKRQIVISLHRTGVLDVSTGGEAWPGRFISSTHASLNLNADSQPLLAVLLAIAQRPNFAIRTSDRKFRTAMDKIVRISSTSVNNRKVNTTVAVTDRSLYAFQEKTVNPSVHATMIWIFGVTRIDPLGYVLFGATQVEHADPGSLLCDQWLKLVGDPSTLASLSRLKAVMDECMRRVLRGIPSQNARVSTTQAQKAAGPSSVWSREMDKFMEEDDGSEVEDEDRNGVALSQDEVLELDQLMTGVVGILNRFYEDNVTSGTFDSNSGTPSTLSTISTPAGPLSPVARPLRMPPLGFRSGEQTPFFLSRPTTPSLLGRQSWVP